MTKIFIRLSILAFIAGIISSCNTTAGIGEDVSKFGGRITNAAERNE